MPLQTPRSFSIVLDARDVLVARFPLPSTHPEPRAVQLAICWDPDKDERVLLVAEALCYRDPRSLARIVGIAESRGTVRYWCTDAAHAAECTRALSAAADAALRHDRWTISPPTIVSAPPPRYLLDRTSLAAGDPLAVVPTKYQLGLVRS